MSRYSDCHKLIKFARSLGIFIHQHASTEPVPDDAFRDDMWMDTDGVHVVMARLRPGRFAHELGHYCLLSPRDRTIVGPSNLSDQGISTIFEDFGAEAWGFAACCQLGIDEDIYFENREDYELSAIVQRQIQADCKVVDPNSDEFPLVMALGYWRHEVAGVQLLKKFGLADDNYPRTMLRWMATQADADAWFAERKKMLPDTVQYHVYRGSDADLANL